MGFHAKSSGAVNCMKKPWLICAAISLCAGCLVGALVMWMAWQHNPQCEIHCAEQGIDWVYWLTLGAGGWLLGFVVCMLPASVVTLLLRK